MIIIKRSFKPISWSKKTCDKIDPDLQCENAFSRDQSQRNTQLFYLRNKAPVSFDMLPLVFCRAVMMIIIILETRTDWNLDDTVTLWNVEKLSKNGHFRETGSYDQSWPNVFIRNVGIITIKIAYSRQILSASSCHQIQWNSPINSE